VDYDEDGYTGDAVLLDTADARPTAKAATSTADAGSPAEAAADTVTGPSAEAATDADARPGAEPVTDTVAGQEIPVRVVLRGYLEPIDGRYHWYGRVAANDEVTALNRAGRRHVRLRTLEGEADGVLSDQDTWGRFRITGTGTPPFRVVTDPPADSTLEPADPNAGQTEVRSPR
jgi:Domain of unknown function (DUF4873)